MWHKRRWVCRESACELGTFTEQIPQTPARVRVTGRLRERAGRQVADGGRTIAAAGLELRLSWPVVQAAFTAYALAVLPDRPPATTGAGDRRDPPG